MDLEKKLSQTLPTDISLRLTSEQIHEDRPKRVFIFSGIVDEYDVKEKPYSGVLSDQQGEISFYVPKDKVSVQKHFEDLLFFSYTHKLPITFSGEYSLENATYLIQSYENPFLTSSELSHFPKPLFASYQAKGVEFFTHKDGIRGQLFDQVGEIPFLISHELFDTDEMSKISFALRAMQVNDGSYIQAFGKYYPGNSLILKSFTCRLADDVWAVHSYNR